jgi:hypothetical protein
MPPLRPISRASSEVGVRKFCSFAISLLIKKKAAAGQIMYACNLRNVITTGLAAALVFIFLK